MTSGIRGSLKQTDFEWSSRGRSDSISFTIDLRKKGKIHIFTLSCITNYGMGVHKPSAIRVAVSLNNADYSPVGELRYVPEEIFREENYIENGSLKLENVESRCVRVTVRGAGLCPLDHARPGQESRVMFDEIMIE